MTPAIALFILGAILLRAGWKNQSVVDAALGRDTHRDTGNVDTGGDFAPSDPGATTNSDLPHGPGAGTPRDIIEQLVIPTAQHHGINVTPASVAAANGRHSRMTLSGNVSDHSGPGNVRWAADMSNGYNTAQEAALARDLAAQFGIPWDGSGMISHTEGGFRYQLGFRTLIGGNHFSHVHFGVRVA